MAFTFQQSRSNTGSDVINLAYSGAVTAAGLLIAAVYWNSNTATCTVTDSVNGSWAAVGSPQTGSEDLATWRVQMFYFLSSASGTPTVTADVSSAVTMGLAIQEYAYGAGNTTEVDGTPVYTIQNNNAAPVSGSVTTTASGDLLFGYVFTGESVANAGTGYVLRESANFGVNGTEDDLDGGTAGAKTASFDMVGTPDNIISLIAFKEVVPPPAGVPIAWIRA